jgi:hypothetical protein
MKSSHESSTKHTKECDELHEEYMKAIGSLGMDSMKRFELGVAYGIAHNGCIRRFGGKL